MTIIENLEINTFNVMVLSKLPHTKYIHKIPSYSFQLFLAQPSSPVFIMIFTG